MTLIYSFSYIKSTLIVHNLALFEMQPEYLCYGSDGILFNCDRAQACAVGSEGMPTVEIDFNSEFSLYNMIDQYKLHCSDSFTIGFIGTAYYLGQIICCLTASKLGDIHGRKYVSVVSSFSSIVAISLLIVSDKILVLYLGMFLIGFF